MRRACDDAGRTPRSEPRGSAVSPARDRRVPCSWRARVVTGRQEARRAGDGIVRDERGWERRPAGLGPPERLWTDVAAGPVAPSIAENQSPSPRSRRGSSGGR